MYRINICMWMFQQQQKHDNKNTEIKEHKNMFLKLLFSKTTFVTSVQLMHTLTACHFTC